MLRPPPRSPLFPYTTLFRSRCLAAFVLGGNHRQDLARRLVDITVADHVLVIFRQAKLDQGLLLPDGKRRGRLGIAAGQPARSEEHTSELQSLTNLVCRLLLE